VELVKSDTRIVTWFTIAGLLVPFGMFFVWWLANRDHPVLTVTSFDRIADILWPGRRFAYIGYIGPWNWGEVVSRILKDEMINALVYAAAGVIVVCIVRVARSYRNRSSVEC
jgi:hypothetical protein